ncbi:MAG: hypothetical protein ACRD0J_13320 [Acidimicrobiales bacterium]
MGRRIPRRSVSAGWAAALDPLVEIPVSTFRGRQGRSGRPSPAKLRLATAMAHHWRPGRPIHLGALCGAWAGVVLDPDRAKAALSDLESWSADAGLALSIDDPDRHPSGWMLRFHPSGAEGLDATGVEDLPVAS